MQIGRRMAQREDNIVGGEKIADYMHHFACMVEQGGGSKKQRRRVGTLCAEAVNIGQRFSASGSRELKKQRSETKDESDSETE